MKGQSSARLLLATAVVVSPLACGGRAERGRAEGGRAEGALVPPGETFAELRAVRRGVSVVPPRERERDPYPRERLADGAQISIRPGGLAWLRRDGGATLLLAGPSEMTLRASGIEIAEGKLFVDTTTSAPADVITPRGTLHLARVRASLEAQKGGGVEIYVLNGAVHCGLALDAGPGEMVTLRPDGTGTKASASAWEDWTGGLATTDPAAEPAPFGVGTVGARRPGDQGQPRFALSIQRLDVTITVDHDLATTEVDEVFFNPTSETVEGIYSFRTPTGASLSRFGVERSSTVVWGRIKEKQAARAQYQSNVYQGSTEDPALLEWDSPGVYKARLYPIAPGSTRRVVTRYSEWLGRQGEKGQRRLYVYPMAAEGVESSLPRIEEFTVNLDLARAAAREVRAGMQAKRSGDRLSVKAFDYIPRADFAVELLDNGIDGVEVYRSPHVIDPDLLDSDALLKAATDAKQEPDYVLVPLRAGRANAKPPGLDLAIVVDTSAATDRGSLALSRAMTGALLAHLGPDDRAAVWAGDATLRPVSEGSEAFSRVDNARREAIATGLSRIDRGGATDLGTMLADAASKVDPKRRSAVVYIGDGKPTVGELALPALRERLSRVPGQIRIFGIGIGDSADLGMIKGIATGGFVERVTDGFGAARSALHLLEEAERPVWIGAEVDLGTGIDRVFPREIGILPADQTVLAVGRVQGELPKRVVVRGAGGKEVENARIVRLDDGGDLRRRWAEQRLSQLLEDGAGRAAVAEIGVRSGIITPYTSFYVLTQAEYKADQERHESDGVAAIRNRSGGGFFSSFGGGLLFSKPASIAVAEYADNKEGGTGTRAKGEEGSMGNPQDRRVDELYAAKATVQAPAASAAAAAPLLVERARLVDAPKAAAPRAGGAKHADGDGNVEGGTGFRDKASAVATVAKPAQAAPAEPNPVVAGFGAGHARPVSRTLAGKSGGGAASPHEVAAKKDGAAAGAQSDPLAMATLGALSSYDDSIGIGLGGSGLGLSGAGAAVAGPRGQVSVGATTVQGSVRNIEPVVAGMKPGFRACHNRALASNPEVAGSARLMVRIGENGEVISVVPTNAGLPSDLVDCLVGRAQSARFAPPQRGGFATLTIPVTFAKTQSGSPFVAFVSTTVGIMGVASHERQRCSSAADLPLEERRTLWAERLAPVGGDPAGILGVYDRALASCEAPTWRERQPLLILMVDAAGSIAREVSLWRALVVHPQAADIVYRAIVTRVRTAAELRQLSDALGMKKLDPSLLVKALSAAKTPEALAAKLKELTTAWPDDLELALKLLEAYEDIGDVGAGRALARYLRSRVDSNTRVRTEVGEYYLRLASGQHGGGAGKTDGAAPADAVAAARDTAEARRTFGEIVEFSPEDPLARRRLGDLLSAHGWYEEAFRQYETLSQLSPDDTSVPVLLATAAQGMGKTEEAIRWIEKAAASTSADANAASARTARSLASAFLAWARDDALRSGRSEEAARLRERARRISALDAASQGAARIVLTWSHPELHVQLWASGLGPPMLATEGDPLLGVAQAILPKEGGGAVELRLGEEDEALARRLGLSAVLTTIVDEGSSDESIARTVVSFGARASAKEAEKARRKQGAKKKDDLLSAMGIGSEPGGTDIVARRFRFEQHSLVEEAL